jgi:hypothetical protein
LNKLISDELIIKDIEDFIEKEKSMNELGMENTK